MLTVQQCNKTLQKVSNLLSGQVLHLQLLHNILEVNSLIQSTEKWLRSNLNATDRHIPAIQSLFQTL